MFKFGKNKKNEVSSSESGAVASASQPGQKRSFFSRLKSGLSKTRDHLAGGVATVVLGRKVIDADLLDDLETQLLVADVGVEATQFLMADLHQRLARKALNDADAVMQSLKTNMQALLAPCEQPLVLEGTPFVILMVGINGSGKTTTIGKLAQYFRADEKTVLLSAGDTFRAAAIEQLQAWGERNDTTVIAQHPGADSASVSFDAFQAARARKVDVMLADTAGRLHTQDNLMEELKKIRRVLSKIDEKAPQEVMLVLDAGMGQNALIQAEQFHEAVGVTSLCITKLDGTAKGGVIFAIAKKLGLPIRFIGVGEGIDDLRPFRANDFIDALFEPVQVAQ